MNNIARTFRISRFQTHVNCMFVERIVLNDGAMQRVFGNEDARNSMPFHKSVCEHASLPSRSIVAVRTIYYCYMGGPSDGLKPESCIIGDGRPRETGCEG